MITMATESACIPFDITLSHREHSLSPGSKIRPPLGLWHPLNGLHSVTIIQIQCHPFVHLWNYGILASLDWSNLPNMLQLYCALNKVGIGELYCISYCLKQWLPTWGLGAPKGLEGKSEGS